MQKLRWTRRRGGEAQAKTPRFVITADQAITCDDTVAYEWYADEIVPPHRRFLHREGSSSHSASRLFPTLEEAKEAAQVWTDHPGAWKHVYAEGTETL